MPSNPRWTHRVRRYGNGLGGGSWEVAMSASPKSRDVVRDDGLWQEDYRKNDVHWYELSLVSWQELRRVGKYQCGITVPREGGHESALQIVTDHLESWYQNDSTDEERNRVGQVHGLPFAGVANTRRVTHRPTSAGSAVSAEPSMVVDDDVSRAFGAIIGAARDAAVQAARQVISEVTVSGGGMSDDEREQLRQLSGHVDRVALALADDISDIKSGVADQGERFAAQINELAAQVNQTRTVVVREPWSGGTVTVQNTHNGFDTVLARTGDGIHSWLYGPAGTGKSTLGKQVFEALGLECHTISATPDMMRHHFFGTVNPLTGEFRETPFYRAYKFGGGLLIDEADNMSGSFFAGLNDGLASGSMLFDNGEVVERHERFRCIASGNTVGHGATALYRRQQLDEATLDRFTYFYVGLDEAIEDAGVAARLGDASQAADLIRVVRVARRNVDQHNLRTVVTPRAAFDGARMLALGEPLVNVVRDRILRGCGPDVGAKLLADTGFDYDTVMGG